MPRFDDVMKEISLSEAQSYGVRVGRRLDEAVKGRVARTIDLINDAAAGNPIARIKLHEALSTSDFPLLVGHALDAILLPAYQAVPQDWRKYIHVGRPLKDFRQVDRIRATRGDGILTEMGEDGNLPYDAPGEAKYSYKPSIYGKARAITWVMLVNDDLDAIKQAPDDLAYQAANTESWFASARFVANTTLFATTGGGRPTGGNKGTAKFNAQTLSAALTQMSKFRDDGDTPFLNRPKYLVHPPALRMSVRQVLNSTLIVADSTAGNVVPSGNPLYQILEPVENPWIPYLDPTNGDTSWYIFSNLSDGWAVEVSFLAGYEAPQLFMKRGDRVAISGGEMDGSFDNGGTAYGVQHTLGGSHTNAVKGWRFGYWSDGTTEPV